MHENLDFITEEGDNKPFEIQVYALSTCGFCKRGLAFLRDNKIHFRYIYVDKLAMDLRQKIKRDLLNKFDDIRIGYPFVVIDDGKDVLVGFTEQKWKDKFLS